jgi:hypothetical protein
MAVKLSPLAGAGWQFFDNLGIPLAGGLLYTYTAGTTTPQATYTSSAGTIASANPIVLDAAGRTANEVWLTVGIAYKFVLQTPAAVTIGTYDNVSGINDVTGASFAPTTGSTSITTLGTITTGTWNATPIGVAYGGTGLTSIPARSIPVANVANTYTTVTPAAGQSVRINAGNTAWEAYTPSTDNPCKAWVNFDGFSPGTIKASLNVSSITYNSTGDYTVSFTTALQDANYAMAGICNSAGSSTTQSMICIASNNFSPQVPILKTASQVRVLVGFASLADNQQMNLAFFR